MGGEYNQNGLVVVTESRLKWWGVDGQEKVSEEIDSMKINVEVYDSNFTDKKDYLGIYETDFNFVYRQKDHTISNIWIGLANPQSDDFTKIRGYLRISLSVLHNDDKRVNT